MLHPHTEIRFVHPDIGYGVFATQPIPMGTFVWFRSRLDRLISPAEFNTMPQAYRRLLDHFAAVTASGDCLLCWDHTRFMNHACRPAIYSAGGLEVAVRDIAADEEITCDYGVMNGSGPMACRCGAPDCRRLIQAEDVLHHGARWDDLARAALRHAGRVPQPLLDLHEDPAAVAALIASPDDMPLHRLQYCPPSLRPSFSDRSDDDAPLTQGKG